MTIGSRDVTVRLPRCGGAADQGCKGIVRCHAHAVLDAKTEVVHGQELKFVQVYEPTGAVSGLYEWSEGHYRALGTEERYGEAWIELSDVTKRFKILSISDPLSAGNRREAFPRIDRTIG